ncbi:MAG: polyphosphate polymerase domain-containing protein [Candidatus Eisenbacteria bacterium]|nr:polyphosphate polymerase domain-containing protein [Candidatus Eisenbacteria bacterium]
MAGGEWQALLSCFPVATPELIARRELRRRTDTKFVLSPASAADLVRAITGDYAVLTAGTELVATYQTLYFDTPELDFFHAHRRGRRVRHKARVRHYPDRSLTMLEVKTRRSKLKTTKLSREHPFGGNELSADDQDFVAIHTGIDRGVLPQVWTHFRRLTLLGLETCERVTLDFDVRMEMGQRHASLSGIVIVEVKQWPYGRGTPVMSALRESGCRPGWTSKYCTGIALTHPGVRLNALLPGLRALEGRAE